MFDAPAKTVTEAQICDVCRAVPYYLVDAARVVQTTMPRSFNMSYYGLYRGELICCCATRYRWVCDKLLPGLVLITLVRTGNAMAGEQVIVPLESVKPDLDVPGQTAAFSLPVYVVPTLYQGGELAEAREFSARDFRPRGRSVSDNESPPPATQDAPLLRSTTVWQRLSEFRTRGRVRLLTLWETGGSSVSLQAGRKGEPSLQWTSRLMNHGGATRGVLDQLFSTSVAGAGRSMHFTPRSSGVETAAKPIKLLEGGVNK